MLKQAGNKVYRRFDKEVLCIQPWGTNSFRIQATQRSEFTEQGDLSPLLPEQDVQGTAFERGPDEVIHNGQIL